MSWSDGALGDAGHSTGIAKKAKIYQIFKLKFQNLRVTEGCWRIAMKIENARNNAALATIVDVSQEFGVTYRALRYYEKRGLLSPIRRGVARYYDEAQRRRLQLIVKAKHLGFTLAEIAEQLAGFEEEDQSGAPKLQLDMATAQAQLGFLEARRQEIDLAIAELRATLCHTHADRRG
jgi:DNA-binding transcriptional MerR regulator